MSWINAGQFQMSDRNGRRYVFRRNNSGNTEINIPASVTTKAQAKRWLKNNPNKVTNPTKFRPKKKPAIGGLKPWETVSPGGGKYVKIVVGGGAKLFPVAKAPMFPAAALPGKYKFSCGIKSKLKVFKQIGKGRQGIAFLSSQHANGKIPFVIKVAPWDLRAEARKELQPSRYEFKIQEEAWKAAPDGVVQPRQIIECPNFIPASDIDMANITNTNFDKARQTIIFMEYCDGGSLKSWLGAQGAKLTDATFKSIISHVLRTLDKIKRAHPYFSHNDLHMDNLFVSKGRALLGDFGWARLDEMGTNPAVNTANGTQASNIWGVGPMTDPRYDHHLFLNELREWIKTHNPARFPGTKAFLDVVVPAGYRGKMDTHVSEWRFKYRDPVTDYPSLTRIMRMAYLAGPKAVTSPALRAAKARLRRLGGAKNLAMVKKNYTNQQLINMMAGNFLKLSPKTRERAKVLRVAAKKPKPVPNKPKGNKGKAPAYTGPPVLPKMTHIPQAVIKSAKFNKLINKIYSTQGGPANESFYNAWNRARTKALSRVANRLAKNLPPFSPSPPKAKAKSPSPPRPKLPPPLSPLGPPKPKAKAPALNFKLSPSSGRAKIKAPGSGRYVYANGSTISMNHLRSLAAAVGVNVKGLRSKANIAKKLFGV
jgi:serine/threonine protein kinase